MKRILLFCLLSTLSLSAQHSGKTCEILSKINTLIQRDHYHPKPIDDSLSVYVFDTFLDRLDNNRNLFTKPEYEKLCKHRLLLDNHILENDCSFLDEFVSVYKTALERKRKIIEKIRPIPFDYTTKDSVKFSKENFPFDLLESDLERVWKKRMRFEVLEDIAKLSKNLDSLKQHFTGLEKISREKIFETNLCKANSILNTKKGLDNLLQNDFLDIFCNYFDPHSNYFSVDARSSFMSALSTSNLSLGLNVGLNDNEEIIVGDIIPGGPAAQSEKFEKGDIIIKVSNKKGEEYWVSCASMETIGEMIFSDNNIEIQITLRKKNGSLLDVDLKKQVMKANENSVYSFIAEKGTRIGYINVSNFYSDFERGSIHGCADDLAKEIIKLQKDNIEGLVIDLQDNGGGSMEEAIKMAGMFIDIGPVSVLVDNQNRQSILRDSNRGAVYNGPLVVLINGNSASASEFFSAAMQDYDRAFIVGSNSLGKATMQTILPIEEKNKEDFVKLTVQKFYRISGESGQIKGIIPDIHLPVLFDTLIQRENSYRTALQHDIISIKTRYQKYNLANKSKVIEMSRQRVRNNNRFNELNQLNTEINTTYNKPRNPVRLTLDDVFGDVHDIDGLWKNVKEITDRPAGITVSNTSYEKEKMQFDPFEQEINKFKMKDVKNNPYLEEAISIIKDYNTLKNQP